jgi:hypothetical protein
MTTLPESSLLRSSSSSSSASSAAVSHAPEIDYTRVPVDDEKHNAFWWLLFMIEHLKTTPIMSNLLILPVGNRQLAKSMLCAQMETFIKTNVPSMPPSKKIDNGGARFIQEILQALVVTSDKTCYVTVDLTYISFKTALLYFFQLMSLFYQKKYECEQTQQTVSLTKDEKKAAADAYYYSLAMMSDEIKADITKTGNPVTVFLLYREYTTVFVGSEMYQLNKSDFEKLLVNASSLQTLSTQAADEATLNTMAHATASSSSEETERPSAKRRALQINTSSGMESQESTPPQSPSNGTHHHHHSSPEKHRVISAAIEATSERMTRQKSVHFETRSNLQIKKV